MADGEAKEERRIMVAVDGGEESMEALSWCLKNIVSNNSKDTIILLYAKTPRIVYSSFSGTGFSGPGGLISSTDVYSNEMADSVIEKAKRLCQVFENLKVETMEETGDPRDVICEAAEKIQPQLLVMGSHGYGPIKRALLGSVSNHCAQHVDCPIMIVKRPKHQRVEN